MQSCRVQTSCDRQSGFTLIEIMLVIVIIATVSAMVVPSFFSISGRSLNDEVRRMQIATRMAVEEAQLTGVPMRLVVLEDGYRFERLDAEKKWLPLEAAPFQPFSLSSKFDLTFHASLGETPNVSGEQEKKVIGHVLLLPDGVATTASVTLAINDDSTDIRFTPGPVSVQVGSDE